MTVIQKARQADATLIESIWHAQAQSSGVDMVIADTNWDMIVTRHEGKTTLTVWGPMTHVAHIPHAEGSEHLGIRFRLGTYMPSIRATSQPNTGLVLPGATSSRFWLGGAAWEYPTFENVETFIGRMVRNDLLRQDSVIESVLHGYDQDISLRTVQRRFLSLTGLTHRTIRTIERAQHALDLLKGGMSIADVVFLAAYADQQHLTRALRRFTGQTPACVARGLGAR